MTISYPALDGVPVWPPFCRCDSPHFHRKGCYLRALAQVWTFFFQCVRCKTHITMVPSICVPYKHFRADDIEYCLGEAISGRSPAEIEADADNTMGVSQSTVKRWLGEWVANSALLASVSSEKLSGACQGDFRSIYQKLSRCCQSRPFIKDLQPDLCRDYPPMGIFRPLIVLLS